MSMLVDRALRLIHDWRAQCQRPAVSCSGGKDSTALLLLTMRVDPTIPVYRADPPNPLSDRAAHVERMQRATPAPWVIVQYEWDVEAVLDSRARYPEGLKIRRLDERLRADGIDGVALGLRAQESRGRTWNALTRGEHYVAMGRRVCTPLSTWTADEVVGFVMAEDRLPLNPVYTKLDGAPDLNRVRDGTWYPRETADAHGYRGWLARHYPEHIEQYDRALAAAARGSNR
jgi:3'-phosphoadenosine 5'-phosphosulfate sulfotransferase (PAPS reductase)/FAD synthetase